MNTVTETKPVWKIEPREDGSWWVLRVTENRSESYGTYKSIVDACEMITITENNTKY